MEQKEKKSIFKKWWFWVLAVIVFFIIIGSTGDSKSRTSIPAPTEIGDNIIDNQQIKAETKTPVSIQTLLDISGSGTKSTAKFTASGDWDLDWNYDCSNFGQNGNFQVYIYNGDGTLSLANSLINQLGKSDTGVEHYHTGGTFYLTVNSVCKWNIQVKG